MFGIDARVAKAVWTIFLFVLFLYIIYTIRTTLLIVVFAVFFAYLVYPLVKFVERSSFPRVPRIAALIIVFILVSATLAIAGSLLGSKMGQEAANLGRQLPELLNPENVSKRIPLPQFLEPMRAQLLGFVTEQLQSKTGGTAPILERLSNGIMHALGNLLYIALIPVLSFLLIKEAVWMKSVFLSWLNAPERRFWADMTKDMHVVLSGYVRALLLLSLATFIGYSIAFSLLGVPYALVLAGICSVLEFIPVIGPLAGALLVLGLSAVTGFDRFAWLVPFFIAYRMVQDYVINPALMSGQLEISPLLVLIGLLAGEELGGAAGMFLSIPVLALIKLVLERVLAQQEAARR
jgi:predicted PurR-regulated permease PerM